MRLYWMTSNATSIVYILYVKRLTSETAKSGLRRRDVETDSGLAERARYHLFILAVMLTLVMDRLNRLGNLIMTKCDSIRVNCVGHLVGRAMDSRQLNRFAAVR
jgi:hypothetical protein